MTEGDAVPTPTDRLIRASHEALAGPDPRDTFAAYGVPFEEAVTFVHGWIAEVEARADEMDVDPNDADFRLQLGTGLLAVGIAFGREQAQSKASVRDALEALEAPEDQD